MNLLAIDSASSVLSVAVCRGVDIWHTVAEAGLKHSEIIMGLIDAQMKNAGLSPNDLNGVLCMGGPGSFTGLRIGYSIAKGLALSLSIPFSPIPTLDCIASSLPDACLVMPVVEVRKNSFFYALFRNGNRLLPDTEVSAGEIDAIIEKNQGVFVLRASDGYAVELVKIAGKRNVFDRDNGAYLFTGPEYLRKTDAEIHA